MSLCCERSCAPNAVAVVVTVDAFGVAAARCSPALPGCTWVSSLHISARMLSALAKAPALSFNIRLTVPVPPSLLAPTISGRFLCMPVCGSSISMEPFSASSSSTSMLAFLAITRIWPMALFTLRPGWLTAAV
ncbi:hypothetical protein D9M71_759560 [compost metagenome]